MSALPLPAVHLTVLCLASVWDDLLLDTAQLVAAL
jgi:hypothetical protein